MPLGEEVNGLPMHWQFSVDRQGTLYFGTGDGRIMVSEMTDGKHQPPEEFSKKFGNGSVRGGSPFISPDGGYLLFSRDGDLFVTFRKENGSWTDPLRFDAPVNSGGNETCPVVSPDGAYLFYVKDWKVYWVAIREMLADLRYGLSYLSPPK